MGLWVNVAVKARGVELSQIRDFIQQRLKSRFGSAKQKQMSEFGDTFTGGSLAQPYGFKSNLEYQKIGPQEFMVTLKGRPAIGLLGYVLLLVVIVFIGFFLVSPINGAMGLVAAIVFVVASRASQKRVARGLEQIAQELTARFS